jgi:hypothetical protein
MFDFLEDTSIPDELKTRVNDLSQQYGPPPESVINDLHTLQQRHQSQQMGGDGGMFGGYSDKPQSQPPIGGGMFDGYSEEAQSNLRMAMVADIIGNLAGRDVGATKGVLALSNNARQLRLQNEQRTAAQNMLGGGASGLTPEQLNLVKLVTVTNPTKGVELFVNMKQQAASMQAAVTKPISHTQMEALGYTPDPSKNYQIKNGKIMEIGGAGVTNYFGTLGQVKDTSGKLFNINNKTGEITPVTNPLTSNQFQSGVPGSSIEPDQGQVSLYRFSSRMDEATKILDGLAANSATDNPYVGFGDSITGLFGKTAQRTGMSDAQQLYAQAAADWLSANLREETGAAIGKDELQQEYEKYFPMPGDRQAVIEQKARSRIGPTRTMYEAAEKARSYYSRNKPATPSRQQAVPPTNKGSGWKDNQHLIKRR